VRENRSCRNAAPRSRLAQGSAYRVSAGMTLILTLTNPAYTLQVSDRLLTQGDREFDPFANKALVFQARDALVSVGYSGLAYVRGAPTDHWLAEQISGEVISERGIRIGALSRWCDIGAAVIRLVQSLNQLPMVWRRGLGEVVIAGWQWPRRKPARLRQILWLLQSPDGRSPYVARQLVARHLPARENLRLLYVPRGAPVSGQEVEELVRRIRGYGPQGHDLAEAALIEEVRRVRTRTLSVGPHCMSILISRFLPLPRVRYHPEGQHSVVLREGPPLPMAFTPWIIGPDTAVTASPVLVRGCSQRNVGGVRERPKSDALRLLLAQSGTGCSPSRSHPRCLPDREPRPA
jgi:hypothetical protein